QLYKKYAGVPKVVIYGVDYFIYTVISDPKWLSRFDIEDSHERPGLFSNPLLLLRHKREIDNFQNNIMIGLKETWETNPEDNAEIEENPFKNIDIIQNYKGVELPGKKLVTQREGITRKVVFHPYPGKEGKYFMKLMEQLDRDGVIVVLVALPDYIGSYKTNYQRLEFIRHLKTLKRNYKRLFIYNYNKPRRFPLANTDYFNDGGFGMANSHLSQKGAEVFCNILIDDIRKHYNK
ncbi:MAG: hypothetical protein GY940_28710, partial [bacterium]|nr:hypothetical protein [bacterium]